ncbi:MAG: hypothetical protein KME04_18060 [Pleurocapsa minor GSE-CHR-MK-17-07R]|nr:hypothetical protein [Pleurocapsa minor GSE-CHR-MK 17-07R]
MFRKVILIFLLFALSITPFAAFAQADLDGTLILNQPLISTLSIPGESRSYAYSLVEPRIVTLQLIGDTAQPSIAILRDGAVVAESANTQGALVVNLSAFLTGGSYVVTVGTANNSTGTVALVLQSEQTPVTTPLQPGQPLSGTLSQQQSLQLYTFNALDERAWLYIISEDESAPVSARLTNSLTNTLVALVSPELGGARMTIPAGGSSFQIAVTGNVQGATSAYTVCYAAVSQASACGETGASAPPPTAQADGPVATPEVTGSTAACTVTPQLAGGANIRQSASVNSILLGALPGGAVANVLGISPDGSFYNIQYNAISSGWVALSVVNSSGDCASVPTVQPPQIIPAPTAIPTQAPTQPPTATSAPTLTPTPAGPCLITMNAAALVYTQPNAIPDYIYDQVQAGYELIPNGRLADNTFWRTNYAGSWIEYSTMLNTATVTGNCGALPIVSP